MDTSDAKRSAEAFLSEFELPAEEYRLAASEPYELADGWYFDLRIEHTGNIPPEAQDHFGGAPGFVVSKRDGSARIVSWEEYSALGLPKRE